MDLFRHTTELGSHVSSDVRLVSLGLFGEWFEPRGISYLFSVIVQVRVVFRKTNNNLFTDYPHPDDHAKQISLQLFTSFGVQLACELRLFWLSCCLFTSSLLFTGGRQYWLRALGVHVSYTRQVMRQPRDHRK